MVTSPKDAEELKSIWMFPKIVGFPPKSSHLYIGFSMIFTIHFGGKHPLFLVQHPYAQKSSWDIFFPKGLLGEK